MDSQLERSIRRAYETCGVEEFYEEYGAFYRNPHEGAIAKVLVQSVQDLPRDGLPILDLACGSGEVTLVLRQLGYLGIEGIDPYTQEAYYQRTGQEAKGYRFEQIEQGILLGQYYGLIVCSFALHLVELSRLPGVAYQLSLIGDRLLIVTPHKRPELRSSWGWELVQEFCLDRVRSRLYQSTQSSDRFS
ncbi:class I SAM-dependent methyltransferase [Roseofilum casamattae]|uniref:Class I SAM-dependent methyltransferase n=1 Tax=Roseofilum casamattae BLCC-M143 TaxID=3022442 RepID=A0ABT7BVM1_9CYAN|nr:class I SAM-dependent methyltransferase [Roseofilum casamattae]MDJ1183239.1 class I SAM-dependent methyltransferase [Roseofilum casamattae BLCC-M143]